MGLFMFFATAGSRGRPRGASGSTPIPFLSTWESYMDTYGRVIGLQAVNLPPAEYLTTGLDTTYYDGAWVQYQIGDYLNTSDPFITTYAPAMKTIYDEYLSNTSYGVAGYGLFPHGYEQDYLRNGTAQSLTDLQGLSNNAAYSLPARTDTGWYVEKYSREVAYNAHVLLSLERAGQARKNNGTDDYIDIYLEMMFDHMNQWITGVIRPSDSARIAPFMVGITCHALIDYYEWEDANGRNPDSQTFPTSLDDSTPKTIPQIVTAIADKMMSPSFTESVSPFRPMYWETLPAGDGDYGKWYQNGGGVFLYEDTGGANCAPVLGNLISPVYAWLWKRTGNTAYRDFGDKLFIGAITVNIDQYSDAKAFNQLYRWSPKYVEWRS